MEHPVIPHCILYYGPSIHLYCLLCTIQRMCIIHAIYLDSKYGHVRSSHNIFEQFNGDNDKQASILSTMHLNVYIVSSVIVN